MLTEVSGRQGRRVEIHKASEPIDIIIREPSSGLTVLAEVKAAPLITIPLAVCCDALTEEAEGTLVSSQHTLCDNPFIRSSVMTLFFPATSALSERRFILPIDWNDSDPFFVAMAKLYRADDGFLSYYFSFWEEAYKAYSTKDKDNPVFWLTNACGMPVPRPEGWPARRSGGYETVSDAKTSVGMDRTDDIKKGIYQVLKLGAEYKPVYPGVKTALISNLHAVRHHDEYLESIKDIIWTIDKTRQVSGWGNVPPGTPLYNLFDGIISFTSSDIRDDSLRNLFIFERI